jgi:putative thioredoxin
MVRNLNKKRPPEQEYGVERGKRRGSGERRRRDFRHHDTDLHEDVIEESKKRPVLVDFWAEWCGPCKSLTPVLEKAVRAAGGAVKLVKMDIDKHPQIPGQLGIQSIPAVFAFDKGQPVDGFVGALPEGQVTAFIERLTGKTNPATELLNEAEAKLAANEFDDATSLFAEVLTDEPTNARALAGLVRCHIAAGDLEQAKETFEMIPAEASKDKTAAPAIIAAKAALDLAEQAGKVSSEGGDLEAKVNADPNDHQARLDLAISLSAKGEKAKAAEHLLAMIKKDRKWNDEAARKQLLQFFEAWGPMDEATVDGRKKLSTILFS